MAKYLLVYHGGSMPEGEEAQGKVMAAWGAWFQNLGPALFIGATAHIHRSSLCCGLANNQRLLTTRAAP